MGTGPRGTAVRWRILLPLIMTLLSAYLMVLAKRQQPTLRKSGTGWEVPARVLNAMINGPGFYFGRFIFIPLPHAVNESLSDDGERMFGIAIFWFVIGLSIDRRVSKRALDLQQPTRAALLFAFAALICGVFAYGGITYVFCPSPNMTCWEQGSKMFGTVVSVVAKYPLRTSASMALSVAGWLLVLSAYFVKRAFTALRRSKLRITT